MTEEQRREARREASRRWYARHKGLAQETKAQEPEPTDGKPEKAFVDSILDKLSPGAVLAFEVTACKANKVVLGLVGRNGFDTVYVENERRKTQWSWPRPIPVSGIVDMAEKMFPNFLIKPGMYTVGELSAIYGMSAPAIYTAVYGALRRRINSRGMKLVTWKWKKGVGRLTTASLKVGSSMAEAELRMAL